MVYLLLISFSIIILIRGNRLSNQPRMTCQGGLKANHCIAIKRITPPITIFFPLFGSTPVNQYIKPTAINNAAAKVPIKITIPQPVMR